MTQQEMVKKINELLQWKASFDEEEKPKPARKKKEESKEAPTVTPAATATTPVATRPWNG